MTFDPKMKKAIYATVWTIFLGIACFITVYAANQYLWEQEQQGHQHVVEPVTGTAYEFDLDEGYVGVASYEFVTPSPVLEITTKKANLTLQITCTNNNTLAGNYSDLTLILYSHTDHVTALGTLDLLSGKTLSYTMKLIGDYKFDYKILYTPTVEADNTMELLVGVTNE